MRSGSIVWMQSLLTVFSSFKYHMVLPCLYFDKCIPRLLDPWSILWSSHPCNPKYLTTDSPLLVIHKSLLVGKENLIYIKITLSTLNASVLWWCIEIVLMTFTPEKKMQSLLTVFSSFKYHMVLPCLYFDKCIPRLLDPWSILWSSHPCNPKYLTTDSPLLVIHKSLLVGKENLIYIKITLSTLNASVLWWCIEIVLMTFTPENKSSKRIATAADIVSVNLDGWRIWR